MSGLPPRPSSMTSREGRTHKYRVVALASERSAGFAGNFWLAVVHAAKLRPVSVQSKGCTRGDVRRSLRHGVPSAICILFGLAPATNATLCSPPSEWIFSDIVENTTGTSLEGVNAAQKLSSGFTVLNVWLPEMSSARRFASSRNLSFSAEVSTICHFTKLPGFVAMCTYSHPRRRLGPRGYWSLQMLSEALPPMGAPLLERKS